MRSRASWAERAPSRRVRRVILAVVLLALPALVLSANLKRPEHVGPVDRVILRLTAPVQSGISALAGGIRSLWRGYAGLRGVHQDNERLRAEIARLKARLARTERTEATIGRLEALLGLRRQNPAETMAARVIGGELTPLLRVRRLRLDRGSGEVRAGQPVLAPDGLVGRVHRVFGPYADVRLLTDPQSAVDVRVARSGSKGVLRGIAADDRYRCRVEYLLRTDEVREGDAVVTSGIGGIFPAGIVVGRVARALKREYGLYQEVEVTPAVDFGKLTEVLVILVPPPPPDPDVSAAGHRSPEPAYGLVPGR